MESVKINTLEFENVKRIRAVALEPSPSGLTVIGGDNNQGKTSILDTIAWALGGDRYRPSKAATSFLATARVSRFSTPVLNTLTFLQGRRRKKDG